MTPRIRAEAALRLFDPTAFASHASAARLLDVPIPTLPDEHVTVFHQRMRRHHRGIRTHVSHTMDVRNLRVFCSPITAGCSWSWPSSWVSSTSWSWAITSWGRAGSPRTSSWPTAPAAPTGQHGRRAARRRTSERTRYDLSFPGARVVVEYDGRQHVERIEAWESDLERREAIDDDGWRILVVVASGIYRSSERTLRRVWRLLRARGLEGVPEHLDDEWRAHFPGHSPSGVRM